MSNALTRHLDRIRKLGHEVQRKNGHYKKMTEAKKAKAAVKAAAKTKQK